MKLNPPVKKYILHWGEMGTRWGVNRTVAQIHALLYLSPEPLCAEDIVNVLSVARSNVSTSIRELQGYGLIRVTHTLGDRRDYFEAISEVWELFSIVVAQRKQREVDPTLSTLRQCVEELDAEPDVNPVTRERMTNMLTHLEMLSDWYSEMMSLPKPKLLKLVKLGKAVARLVR